MKGAGGRFSISFLSESARLMSLFMFLTWLKPSKPILQHSFFFFFFPLWKIGICSWSNTWHFVWWKKKYMKVEANSNKKKNRFYYPHTWAELKMPSFIQIICCLNLEKVDALAKIYKSLTSGELYRWLLHCS